MGSTFAVYLELGARHIADLSGYDHILFVAALVVAWPVSAWRRLLVLVTAFTVGHSITLVLATLQLLAVNASWIEFLIPVTIALTALGAIVQQQRDPDPAVSDARSFTARYVGAAAFGLIHGLGFSTFLRAALGQEESLFVPLLAFNLGLEFGQVAIVGGVLALGVVASRVLRVPRRVWVIGVSLLILLAALRMAADRLPS